MPEPQQERTYHVLGVPLRTGSLYPGSENDAQAYRDAHLLQRLEAARQALQAIPAAAPILLHFDIAVLHKQDMPAAYFRTPTA
jgi:hypothetical protein